MTTCLRQASSLLRMQRNRRATAWLVAGLLCLAPTRAIGQQPLGAVIDSLVVAELETRPMAGIQAAVIHGRDTLYWRSHGWADIEHGVALNRDGVFQVASITKQFTAAAVLRLVERGKMALDDDIRVYLPELDTGEQTVRIRQMLNHTSGLPNIYQMTSWPDIRPLRLLRPEARKLEAAGVAEDSLDFAPGTDFRYSNTGYDLLGDAIEAVTGEDIESHFQNEIFGPSGLEHTSFCPWTRVIPNRVRGYEPDSTGAFLENARRQAQGILFTSGGICSTVGDLIRWSGALHHRQILDDPSYEAMITPDGAASTYGLGLYVRNLEGLRTLQHNGYTPGFSSQLDYYPDDRLTVVVLANSPAAVRTLAEDIAREVLGLGQRPVASRPEGWRLTPLDPEADTTATHFRRMGPGLHVTSGPVATYSHADSLAEGEFTLEATLVGLADPGPEEGHGLLFGGSSVGGPDETYLAFTTRQSGEFALVRHRGGDRTVVVPWTSSDAVETEGGAGNTLSVSVSRGFVELSVNGQQVVSLTTGEVGGTDGVVGLWIGTGGDVHIDGFGVVES